MNRCAVLGNSRSLVSIVSGIFILAGAALLAGCVNDSGTGALTSTEIQAKQTSHEERYVAGKCNSANRLSSSNTASEALTSLLTAYSQAEAGMDPAKKADITATLEGHGQALESHDQNLKSQCISYSICEYQAGTTKQNCSTDKHKFIESERQMLKLAKQIAKTQI